MSDPANIQQSFTNFQQTPSLLTEKTSHNSTSTLLSQSNLRTRTNYRIILFFSDLEYLMCFWFTTKALMFTTVQFGIRGI